MDTSNDKNLCGDIVHTVLWLLEAGNQLIRRRGQSQQDCTTFYDVKDELMGKFHRHLGGTAAVSYRLVPYVRRCASCKQKADALQALDPDHTSEHHLALLPTCPRDQEVTEKTCVEQRICWGDREFCFLIPLPKTAVWRLDIERLDRRP